MARRPSRRPSNSRWITWRFFTSSTHPAQISRKGRVAARTTKRAAFWGMPYFRGTKTTAPYAMAGASSGTLALSKTPAAGLLRDTCKGSAAGSQACSVSAAGRAPRRRCGRRLDCRAPDSENAASIALSLRRPQFRQFSVLEDWPLWHHRSAHDHPPNPAGSGRRERPDHALAQSLLCPHALDGGADRCTQRHHACTRGTGTTLRGILVSALRVCPAQGLFAAGCGRPDAGLLRPW